MTEDAGMGEREPELIEVTLSAAAEAVEILDLLTQDPRNEQADPDECAKRVVRAALRALGADRSKVKHVFKRPGGSEG